MQRERQHQRDRKDLEWLLHVSNVLVDAVMDVARRFDPGGSRSGGPL